MEEVWEFVSCTYAHNVAVIVSNCTFDSNAAHLGANAFIDITSLEVCDTCFHVSVTAPSLMGMPVTVVVDCTLSTSILKNCCPAQVPILCYVHEHHGYTGIIFLGIYFQATGIHSRTERHSLL